MVLSRSARRRTVLTAGLPCAAVVGAAGELSPASLAAVLTAGGVVAALALAGRSGAGAPPVGRRGRPWLLGLGLALAGEAVALVLPGVPTLSDLLDPVLAPPPVRAAATLGWLAAGGWLLGRPADPAPAGAGRATAGRAVAAAMRTLPGRITVLAAWLWLGVHFLAR